MKTAVITGACGGLGKAFVKLCIERNYRLFLVGTENSRLNELKKEIGNQVPSEVYVCDLSELDQCEQLCEVLRHRKIDLLINNAGIGSYGSFDDTEINVMKAMNHINMTSLMMLSHAVLEQMKLHKGAILNVASTASFQPGPMMANYYATKAYVVSLSEALSMELKGTAVSVCALCCGPMETGFSKKAQLKHTWIQKKMMIDPMKAAEIGLNAVEKRKIQIGRAHV